jgi:malate/lactate dehydrogenase
MRDWLFGTPDRSWTSMAVLSQGEYGISPGLFFSFPVSAERGEWSVVEGLSLGREAEAYIRLSEEELLTERDLIGHLLP